LWKRGQELARKLAPSAKEALRAHLVKRVSPEAMSWLDQQTNLAEAFPAVSRKLGREPLGASDAAVALDGSEVPLRAWRCDDAGRALLILNAPDPEAAARELYFQGDLREKAGALRALAIAGRGDAAMLLDAMRLAADELVEAALADNPQVEHLPEHEFRRAVLKCAFVGISIERIQPMRADGELTRMLLGLASEREAAGRTVPADLWPVASLAPIPGLLAKLVGLLEHGNVAQRTAAARGLGRFPAEDRERARPFLLDRFSRETDETAKRAIDWALA
jgi:hypothetical protein